LLLAWVGVKTEIALYDREGLAREDVSQRKATEEYSHA
jgi:hypothetical protein